MSKTQDLRLFPIKNEDKFENFCLDLYKRKFNDPNMRRNGRRGQRQNGVDLFGTKLDTMDWIGIQCKVKSTENILTKKEIDDEIRKAFSFNPKLSEYIFVTTGARDTSLQEYVRLKSVENIEKGGFSVFIDFWNDIELELSEEKNLDLCYKYYSDFIIDSLKFGHSIGKLISLEIGIGGSANTRYELMIGKIPTFDKSSCFGLNYFQNSYFIVDLNNKKFDTFPIPCYPSDLENVFESNYSQLIISNWINGINIEQLIYDSCLDYDGFISPKEYKKFLDSLKEYERE